MTEEKTELERNFICERDHTPCPEGYRDWCEWAAKMHKTHEQYKCAGCGLYKVWRRKHR